MPTGQPWRTSCLRCAAPLHPAGAGWWTLSPAGRCGRCRQRLGAPAGAVEVYTAAAVTVAVYSSPEVLVAAAAVWWVLCAVPLTFVDMAVHRLPTSLTYAAAAGVFLLLGGAAAISGQWSPWVSALLSGALAALVFLGLAMVPAGRGIGLGDVKLVLGVAGLPGWWGWGTAFGTVFVAFLLLGVTGVVLLATGRATRQTQIPYGPQLIASTMGMLALLAFFGSA
ncbi:prepilin peptidase [Actinoplanes regularis]|uniref:prepilin peptidase n=1 Tax=Actinoplanes regularis TaxID=52697 RepID=UPI002552B1DA|nr:prepilin peptidase [Actinoplanes regularis]